MAPESAWEHLPSRATDHLVEGAGELGIPIADQEPELAEVVAERHQQVPGLLCHPLSGRSKTVSTVKQVHRQHPGGLGPGGIAAS